MLVKDYKPEKVDIHPYNSGTKKPYIDMNANMVVRDCNLTNLQR